MPPALRIAAGIALIVLPVVGLILKFSVFPGWMMFMMMMAAPVLLIGYAVQVVIAGNAMLRERGVFAGAPGAGRGITAAFVTSISFLLAMFFLVDGGDDGTFGSAFTELIGTSSTGVGEEQSMLFFLPLAALCVLSWVWLVAEWIFQLVRARRKAVTPAAKTAG